MTSYEKISKLTENKNKIKLISKMSITEFAKEAGVSTASVTRYCQRLGYGSFKNYQIIFSGNELKLELQLTKSANMNIDKKVSILVDEIKKARRVIIVGMGSSSVSANEMANQLVKLKVPAFSFSDFHRIITSIPSFDHRDLIIIFSEHANNREIIFLINRLIHFTKIKKYIIGSHKEFPGFNNIVIPINDNEFRIIPNLSINRQIEVAAQIIKQYTIKHNLEELNIIGASLLNQWNNSGK